MFVTFCISESVFDQVLTVSKQMHYVNTVVNSVFLYLIRQSDKGVDNRADLQDNEVVVESKTGKIVTVEDQDSESEEEEMDA